MCRLDGYNLDLSCPPPTRRSPPCDEKKESGIIYFMLSLMGICMLALSGHCSALTRPGVSAKAQSVMCLGNAITILAFMVSDASYAFSADLPSAIPKEGIYFNLALFGTLGALSYSAWTASGSAMPKLANMVPKGRFGRPYLVGMINILLVSIPAFFMREKFIETCAHHLGVGVLGTE